MAGGGFFMLIEKLIGVVRLRMGADSADAGPWAIFFGVAVDLFSDGV